MNDQMEPALSFPVGYDSRNSEHPDRFWIGTAPHRAFVLLDDDWRSQLTKEEIVGLAAGAWHALTKQSCNRADAELIATAWFASFERNAALLAQAHGSIILPVHHVLQ